MILKLNSNIARNELIFLISGLLGKLFGATLIYAKLLDSIGIRQNIFNSLAGKSFYGRDH